MRCGAGMLIALGVSSASCSNSGRQNAREPEPQNGGTVTKTSTSAGATLAKEADQHWQKREDKSELLLAIETWERGVAEDPSNANALARLSRAYYFLADGHLALEAGDHDAEELTTYEKGM